MTPEAQRIAIAEACGFSGEFSKRWIFEIGIEGEDQFVFAATRNHLDEEVPDYLNDLNAMHEAEKLFMPPEQKSRWLDILSSVVIGRDIEWEDYHCFPEVAQATAAQRAEAFLRTLGKWE